jgi:hypothetical protein
MGVNFKEGVIRLCNDKGETQGTGLVITDHLALSCAHVVESCGGSKRGDSVRVVFELNGDKCDAQVLSELWRDRDRDDIAVLQFTDSLPEGVSPVRLGQTSGIKGHPCSTFGYPKIGKVSGIEGRGQCYRIVAEESGRQLIQLTSTEITAGFSGAPLLDEVTGRIIGMISEVAKPDRYGRLGETAFATPSEILHALLHPLIPDFKLHPPQAVEDYLKGVIDYYEQSPYLTLHNVNSFKNLKEEYSQVRVRLQRQESEIVNQQQSAEESKHSESVSIAQLMQNKEHAHVLIRGEPGVGKSILLRQLAMHAWTSPETIGLNEPHLPILVSLREFANVQGGLEERLNRVLVLEKQISEELPKGFLTDWSLLTGRRWLILLDALDEVPKNMLDAILQDMRLVLRDLGRNRIIITSRLFASRLDTFDPKIFGRYTLLPFTAEQINEFAREWFADQAEAFLQELNRVRVNALGKTPLLLTIAARVYREKHALPERRSALYTQFVDIWLDEAKARGLEDELGNRVTKVAKSGLARLALAITEGADRLTEGDLVQRAAEYLGEALHLSEDEAESDGKEFVQTMARRSGILLRRGDIYDWVHPTFREYLAAYAVVRECRQDAECVWRRAVAQFAEKDWREVSLFALSLLSDTERDVTAWVDRLLSAGAEGLFFAGRALAEHVELTETACRRIIDNLLSYARIPYHDGPAAAKWRGKGEPLSREDAAEAVAEARSSYGFAYPDVLFILYRLSSYPYAVDGVLTLGLDPQVDCQIRMRVAELLSDWGHLEKQVAVLLAIARDPRFPPRSSQAVFELSKLRRGPELLVLARDDKAFIAQRELAAFELGRLGFHPDLLALGQDKRMPPLVRMSVARALGNLSRLAEAEEILFSIVQDEELDAEDRWLAVVILRKSFKRIEETYPAVVALARDGRAHPDRRALMVRALVNCGRIDDLRTLAWDEVVDAKVRVRVAEGLSLLGHRDEAQDLLLQLVLDERVDADAQRMALRNFDDVHFATYLLELDQVAHELADKEVRQAFERNIERMRRLMRSG